MRIPIKTPRELGLAIRATRKSQGVRLDDVSGSARVGHVFVREVEHGKETVALGKVMALLNELGIELSADLPESAQAIHEQLLVTGLRPIKLRRSRKRPAANDTMIPEP